MTLKSAFSIVSVREEYYEKTIEVIHASISKLNGADYSLAGLQFLLAYYSIEKIQEEKNFLYLGLCNDKVVGTIGVKDNFISTLFVDPVETRSGIGRMLMCFAEDKITKAGFSSIQLSSSLTAHSFYKKLGYRDTFSETVVFGKVYNMEKILKR